MRISINLQSVVQVTLTAEGLKLWKRDRKARDLRECGPPRQGFLKNRQLTICLGELMRVFGSSIELSPFDAAPLDSPFEGSIDLVPDNLLPAELR